VNTKVIEVFFKQKYSNTLGDELTPLKLPFAGTFLLYSLSYMFRSEKK
jgi:hypothetical protein